MAEQRESAQDRNGARLRPSVLGVRLNILVLVIIFFVAAVLIVISYNAYNASVFGSVRDSMTQAADKLHTTLTTGRGSFAYEGAGSPEEEDPAGQTSRLVRLARVVRTPAFRGMRESVMTSSEDSTAKAETIRIWMNSHDDQGAALGPLSVDPLEGSIFMDLLAPWTDLYGFRIDNGLMRLMVTSEGEDGSRILMFEEEGEFNAMFLRFGDENALASSFAAYGPEDTVPPMLYAEGEKWTMIHAIPLKDPETQTVCRLWLSQDMTVRVNDRRTFLKNSILMTAGLSLFAIAAMVFLLRRMLVDPIRRISEATRNFVSEDRSLSKADVTELNIHSRDEIGDLARNLQAMENRIVDYTEEQTRITAERERISTEMNLAARIQSAMLPHVFPPFPDRPEFDIYASMDPAKEVGGDFYDFFFTDPDHLCMVIADVSGKGVPASLYMMIAKVIIQSCAMLGLSVEEILGKTNEALSANNAEHMFVTVWLGILETSSGRLTAANAGHEYPAVMKAGGPFEVMKDPHGIFIGAKPNARYKAYGLRMEPGGKLFVYTDGVPEAMDAENRMYGTERMAAALNRLKDETPEGIIRGVRADVDAFVGGAAQFDDLTMLCVTYNGPAGRAE